MGNNTVSNLLEPPQSVSFYSSLVWETIEKTRQPTRPPMTAKIEPVINIGMQKSTTIADDDVTRNTSHVLLSS
jgi:hypothetical protein